jgi:hypothetical protein
MAICSPPPPVEWIFNLKSINRHTVVSQTNVFADENYFLSKKQKQNKKRIFFKN